MNRNDLPCIGWLAALLICTLATVVVGAPRATAPATQPATVRCAVIGGIQDIGFWDALSDRFETRTGIHVEVVASEPRDGIDRLFREGGIDLIVMHSSDAMINLVADGLAMNPQPWARDDMVIVGPPDDPAGIKGETDALKALKKIASAKAGFVVHSSLGAQDVLRAILDEGDITLDPEHTRVLFDDKQQRVLKIAADEKAYTLVGRIPFRSGKLPNDGLAVMVEGDARLRRPYLVAVADPSRITGARVGDARRLAAFLRSPETQSWIATFGKGKLDEHPLFFPVQASAATTRPAGTVLSIGGEISHPRDLTADIFAATPHQDVTVKDRDGKEIVYSGVLVESLLADAGISVGNAHGRNEALMLSVIVQASDGYKCIFSLAELDEKLAGRKVLLANRKDGHPLDEKEGPLRLIVPGDSRPVRWVRQVTELRVTGPGSY